MDLALAGKSSSFNGGGLQWAKGKTGVTAVFFDAYEERNIIVAEGFQAYSHIFDFLKKKLGSDFVTSRNHSVFLFTRSSILVILSSHLS